MCQRMFSWAPRLYFLARGKSTVHILENLKSEMIFTWSIACWFGSATSLILSASIKFAVLFFCHHAPPRFPFPSPNTQDSSTCSRYPVCRVGSYGLSLLNKRLKGIPGSKPMREDQEGKRGVSMVILFWFLERKKKGGRVLSRDWKQKS